MSNIQSTIKWFGFQFGSVTFGRLVYLNMSVILEPAWTAVQAVSRINNMLKWVNSGETGISEEKLNQFDGALYTEHNGTTLLATYKILMLWYHSSMKHKNTWQTLDRWLTYVFWLDGDILLEVIARNCLRSRWCKLTNMTQTRTTWSQYMHTLQ